MVCSSATDNIPGAKELILPNRDLPEWAEYSESKKKKEKVNHNLIRVELHFPKIEGSIPDLNISTSLSLNNHFPGDFRSLQNVDNIHNVSSEPKNQWIITHFVCKKKSFIHSFMHSSVGKSTTSNGIHLASALILQNVRIKGTFLILKTFHHHHQHQEQPN